MNKELMFLHQCVKCGVTTDDLGYLTKWYFDHIDDILGQPYFTKVSNVLSTDFFDNCTRVKYALENFIK